MNDDPAFRRLSTPQPSPHAPRYRRWRIWHDAGHYEHGIVYRETTWRAESPTGDQIAAPLPGPGEKPIDGYAWCKAEIDRLEDAKLKERQK